jgi:hypothetical protein
MGLNHDFLLLSAHEHRYTDYLKWINHPTAIQIHDDVMRFMVDGLNAITCYNPARKMMTHRGLNFYGPTVIKSDGAADAQAVFSVWATLLSKRPSSDKLTGVVESLITVAKYSKAVADSDDELFILHSGI